MAWRWAWLLGFALMGPVALPAGGADPRQPDPRRRGSSGPLLSARPMFLKSSPLTQAPAVLGLQRDTPMRVLRLWQANNGERWAHVQVLADQELALGQRHRRGWVKL